MKSLYRKDPKAVKSVSDFTFDQLLESYERLHLPKVRIQTQQRYKIDIDHRIKPTFQYFKLKDITTEMIMEFQTKLLNELKPKSVNNCMAVLKAMFNFGITLKMTREFIKVPNRTHSWWENWDHVQKFLHAIANEPLGHDFFRGRKDPYAVAYRLALECGLRLGEVVGLSKGDIDFERGQILVHRQWLVKLMCYGPTKHNRSRAIGFDSSSDLARMLKEAVENSPDPEIIFVTLNGERVRSDKLAGFYFAAWIEKLGLPKITFHDLRHTFASWFMIRSGDMWELMELLGHSDVKTTMRYAHLSSKVLNVVSL